MLDHSNTTYTLKKGISLLNKHLMLWLILFSILPKHTVEYTRKKKKNLDSFRWLTWNFIIFPPIWLKKSYSHSHTYTTHSPSTPISGIANPLLFTKRTMHTSPSQAKLYHSYLLETPSSSQVSPIYPLRLNSLLTSSVNHLCLSSSKLCFLYRFLQFY